MRCWTTIELSICGGFELGRMSATGFGVDLPASKAIAWAAVPFGATVGWAPARHFGLELAGGAALAITRPNWLLEDIGDIDRPAAVAGRVRGGGYFRF